MTNEGAPAPDFALVSDDGRTLRLASFEGQPLVLYFYPRDDTPGCTSEAKDFSCLMPKFAAAGVAVIRVSPDDAKSHAKFRAKHALAVPLASDEQTRAAQAYGVWGEKSMYGRTFMGIERSTFLIDKHGTIARCWRKVKVAGHAEEVLAAARALAT